MCDGADRGPARRRPGAGPARLRGPRRHREGAPRGRDRLPDEGPDRGGARRRDPRRGRRWQPRLSYAEPAMLQVLAVVHVLISAALISLILMHSGRDAGLGGMGFTPTSQGGTHIVERNLTRLTIVVAVLFFANTIALYRLLQ